MNDDLQAVIAALVEAGGTYEHLIVEHAQAIGDVLHDEIKRRACAMPSVAAAIAVATHVVVQMLVETVEFAERSMSGDVTDERTIRDATFRLFSELLSIKYPNALRAVGDA